MGFSATACALKLTVCLRSLGDMQMKPFALVNQRVDLRHKEDLASLVKNTKQLLHVKYHRTNYGKFSLKAKGTKLWNDLPNEAKNSKSYFVFRRKMKSILLNTYNIRTF